MAKYGVNLVRIHRAFFDERGEPDPAAVAWAQEVVRTMKAEGISTQLSIYFPSASGVLATPLDANGYPCAPPFPARTISLLPQILYYHLARLQP